MVCSISELQYKEVIDITDGTRYGYIADVELDPQAGTIESIVIRGKPRWFGLLGREPDTIFPWTSITRFGEDLILVDGQQRRAPLSPAAGSQES
ncbi:YlmC/YmxH family sporulation protein [Pseudoflavonifractor sp. An85]|uniref:YlmC/YmxH family sporulation protein n=1 Tax=Pseudoflavonifractor sp. An85 TaxID=1965661 RepID=UPI000B39AF57|nr:YlmC/YmxH family sporulation protein [Pseudoflavonifractor sp. An85]OUN24256.1 YlmC/YmxH family sporulation protein [Pseudoflavonifractor sp. An85]